MAIKKTPVEDFLNEYTRHLLSHKWCPAQLHKPNLIPAFAENERVFHEHAKTKGWISKRDDKVLSSGFKTAAAYLRR